MFCEPILAPYQRILRASPEEWLGSLRTLLELPELRFVSQPTSIEYSSIAQLEAPSARLTSLCVPEASSVFSVNTNRPALIWVRSGLIQNRKDVFMIPSAEPTMLTTEGHAALTIVQFEPTDRWPDFDFALTPHQRQQIRWLLEHYQLGSHYFADHNTTVRETEAMLTQLADCLSKPSLALSLPRRRMVDPRIDRVTHFICNNPDWEFNLNDLVEMTHSSERTLYNRMKRATGMTPYRYYQRCKLLRLRAALLRCEADSPSISWHALEHGFNHLGRLPSLYMKLFGEKPSDTLAQRKRLRASALQDQHQPEPDSQRRSI